jgi:hypothetical protein
MLIEQDMAELNEQALTLLLSAVLTFFLVRAHRRYAGRCPDCGQMIPGSYEIGMQCPHCATTLHPWLLANY